MKVALIHTVTRLGAKKHNIDRMRRLTREAKTKGARIVILPSMFNYGAFFSFYSPTQAKNILKNHAERIPMGSTSNMLTHIAVNNGVHIITGPIMERAGPRIFLTSVVVSPGGFVVGKYRKIILDPGDEHLGISRGRSFFVYEMQEKFGIISENDIAYPEVARGLLLSKATVIVAFPRIMQSMDPRVKKLLESRSIENNVPIIAVGGGVKSHDQLQGEIPSLIIDPREGILEEISIYGKGGDGDEDKVILIELRPAPSGDEKTHENVKELINMIYQDIRRNKKKNNDTEKDKQH